MSPTKLQHSQHQHAAHWPYASMDASLNTTYFHNAVLTCWSDLHHDHDPFPAFSRLPHCAAPTAYRTLILPGLVMVCSRADQPCLCQLGERSANSQPATSSCDTSHPQLLNCCSRSDQMSIRCAQLDSGEGQVSVHTA